ncbi:dual specificity mitogen-activated protein kinase kinase 1 [Diplodia corticola]|uniref:Dual specificity mitogen-activated protein kinase kinase 1 n=1 Tax=Diplodia corticola TaxID=236234 RepID=A0A1J9RH58_9PEZI|nr:dual specificity mitogen-activated protein kinase kinase 1 [Diplodia corticola]OJD31883.1 dual specificity mitogen-activated protein kinase kinase 1 [Diplodia corticola]
MNPFQAPPQYPPRKLISPSMLQLDGSHPQQTPGTASFQGNPLSGTALASPMYHCGGNILAASAFSSKPHTYEPSSRHDLYEGSSVDWSIFDGVDLTTPSTISTVGSSDSRLSSFQRHSASDTARLDFTPRTSSENSFSRMDVEEVTTPIDAKAADLCHRWLSNFSPCWPEDKDFAALQQLTGESITRIKIWFGQRLSQPAPLPPSSSFSSTSNQYLQLVSPPSSSPPTPFHSLPNAEAPASRNISPPTNHHHSRAFKPQTHRCTPTDSPERLHTQDPSRPFQCTRACGRVFPRKGEWIKHEQKSRPQRIWLCTVGAATAPPSASAEQAPDQRHRCASCGALDPTSSHFVTDHWEDEGEGKRWCRKQFMRKDHLVVHLRTVHGVDRDAGLGHYGAVGELEVGEELEGWYCWCGFCRRKDCFKGWRERMDHLGRHFKKDGLTMGDWRVGPGQKADGD